MFCRPETEADNKSMSSAYTMTPINALQKYQIWPLLNRRSKMLLESSAKFKSTFKFYVLHFHALQVCFAILCPAIQGLLTGPSLSAPPSYEHLSSSLKYGWIILFYKAAASSGRTSASRRNLETSARWFRACAGFFRPWCSYRWAWPCCRLRTTIRRAQ